MKFTATLTDTDFDGVYALDLDDPVPNGHELHFIKQTAGVRMAEFMDAVKSGDYDFVVALVTIAVWRSGKIQHGEQAAFVANALLMDPAFEKITFQVVKEPDAGPPEKPQASGNADNGKSGDASTLSSQDSRSIGDDPQETTPDRIGTPGSEASAVSVHATSVT